MKYAILIAVLLVSACSGTCDGRGCYTEPQASFFVSIYHK